jgi:hypothetical protein
VNGQPPVLGDGVGNDDGAQPERRGSALDDQARQRKLAALRKFFADVDAEVARLTKADKQRAERDVIEGFDGSGLLAVVGQLRGYVQHCEFGLLTADRVGQRKAERLAARESLERVLRAADLSFVPLLGVGQEAQPNGSIFRKAEDFYFVPNSRRGGTSLPDFFSRMLSLTRTHDQAFLIYGPGDGTAELVVVDGSEDLYTTISRRAGALHRGGIRRVYPGLRRAGLLAAEACKARGEILSPWSWPEDADRPVITWSLR